MSKEQKVEMIQRVYAGYEKELEKDLKNADFLETNELYKPRKDQ